MSMSMRSRAPFTSSDETVYHSEVPPGAEAEMLRREADRMRGLLLTQENLDNEKKIVTFLRQPLKGLELPIERDGARVLRTEGHQIFTVYGPTPKGPVFMTLIEKAAGGKEQTTRTWQTVEKVAKA